MQEDPLHICSTSKEAALALRHHSFAIFKPSSEVAKSLARATTAARQFLGSTKEENVDEHRVVVKGNLFGFSVPSDAKVLFRAICSDWGGPSMPWPNQELKQASLQVASNLHDLLVECYQEIEKLVQEEEDDKQRGERMPANKKRKTDKHTASEKSLGETMPLTSRSSSTNNALRLPPTLKEAQYSPLDYFLYHATKPTITCSEHIDRGVLIYVGLTSVPGLEVMPRSGTDFVCPEEVLLTGQETQYQHDLLCIMTGDQLRSLLSTGKRDGEDDTWGACDHRVKTQLKGSRLSITYEVRAIAVKD